MSFDFAPELTDGVIRIRPLGTEDFDALYAAASDPLIWEQHPAKNRHEQAIFRPYFDFLIEAGGTVLIEDLETQSAIGCSRFYEVAERPDTMAIGFTFLTRPHWGGSTNRRVKNLMLNHIFRFFDDAWLDIGPDNIRSQRAAEKIGAVYDGDAVFDLGTGAAEYKCYRLKKAAFVN